MKPAEPNTAGTVSCSSIPPSSPVSLGSPGGGGVTAVGIGAGDPRNCECSTIGLIPYSAHSAAGLSVSG
jgi:hypothetical protein